MPFDAAPEISHPEMRRLRDRLLDKSTWPRGFKWDFNCCGTCAMALLVGVDVPNSMIITKTMLKLNINMDTVCHLFGGAVSLRRGLTNNQITPEMVAADIDTWLEKHGG